MPLRPRDPNQLAKVIVDIAAGEVEDKASEKKRNANPRGRAGGLKGGKARAQVLSSQRLQSIAKHGADIRWAAKSESGQK